MGNSAEWMRSSTAVDTNIPLIELLKKSVRRLVGFDSITEHAEHLAERLANRCMMIYDKDRRVHRHDTCG